jgi:hypothetical protein
MTHRCSTAGGSGLAIALLTPAALGQYAIAWSATDCGAPAVSAGPYTLLAAIGQGAAGPVGSAGAYTLTTGFLVDQAPPPCYPNCDGSTQSPVLNVADFSCFLTKYASQDPYANCDHSTQPPTLNVADFSCFLQKYASGCP